jgi:drug/metabolite transporter (DMT)-like permease
MLTPRTHAVRRVDLVLILLVTLAWGVNYTVMKAVVSNFPPISFRALTFLFGLLFIGLDGISRREHFRVAREEWGLVLRISFFNMVLWHLGLIVSLTLLNSGRAAIVGYTMPVWALLTSVIVYKAKMTVRAAIGVLLALCATYLLAIDEFRKFTGEPLGLALILGAAICWGIGNAMVKHNSLAVSSVVLNFWSLAIAFFLSTILAAVVEQSLWRAPTVMEWIGIFYNGAIVLALGYVAWFTVARRLSAVSSGLSIMFVPMVAVFGGAIWLSEPITATDLLALAFILAAMASVLLPGRAGAKAPAD